MDFEDVGNEVTPARTALILTFVSALGVYFLIAPGLSVSISQDIAGLGIFRSTSTVNGQCEYVTAVSRSISTGPVSNANWGPNQFYTETDQLRYSYYSGTFANNACTGTITASFVVASPLFPITPAMVLSACPNALKSTSCAFYTKVVIQTYDSLYSSVMSGQGGPFVPLYAGGLSGAIAPTNILAWETVAT